MSNDIPVSSIKQQPLTDTPVHSDSTIMDDTIMTMDGAALMGGPVAISENIKTVIKDPLQSTSIPRTS